MKKTAFTILILLSLFSITNFSLVKIVYAAGHTFSDSGYSISTNKFSVNQIVYVRVEASSTNSEKILRLLDANKNQIKQIEMSQNNNIYTASFNAPVGDGVYYVDIRISDGNGSVFASQENINVGSGGSSAYSSVNTSINSSENRVEVNSGDVSVKVSGEGKVTVNGKEYTSNNTPQSPVVSQEPTPIEEPEELLLETPTPTPPIQETKNIFQQINNFFSGLLSKLTNLL